MEGEWDLKDTTSVVALILWKRKGTLGLVAEGLLMKKGEDSEVSYEER